MHYVRVISLSSRARTGLHRHEISHAAWSCGILSCGPHRRQPLCTRSEASADTHVRHEDARSGSHKQIAATKPVGLDADGRLYSYLLQHTREPEVRSPLADRRLIHMHVTTLHQACKAGLPSRLAQPAGISRPAPLLARERRLHSHTVMQLIIVATCQVLRKLRAETVRAMPTGARMQISPEQGQLIGLLVEAIGARRAIEVGTFTGYSSIAIAQVRAARQIIHL